MGDNAFHEEPIDVMQEHRKFISSELQTIKTHCDTLELHNNGLASRDDLDLESAVEQLKAHWENLNAVTRSSAGKDLFDRLGEDERDEVKVARNRTNKLLKFFGQAVE